MTLSPELLSIIKDVKPASDEEIVRWIKPFASHENAYIVRLIARIFEGRKVVERLRGEDWENACHELFWETGNIEQFELIQRRAEENANERAAALSAL